MNLTLTLCSTFILVWMALLFTESSSLLNLVIVNGTLQLLLFIVVVCIPLHRTGRMSYVDIAWPFGVALIGVLTLLLAEGYWLRTIVVATVYLFIGLRMGLGALTVARLEGLIVKKEFPRYQYRRMLLEKSGAKHVSWQLQAEVLSQGLANASILALPAFIISSNTHPEFTVWEIAGLSLWAIAYILESVADGQKMLFISRNKGGVCNIGLWRYSRHPNYFAEWLVWSGLTIASIPSWYAMQSSESTLVWLVMAFGILCASAMMYLTLVYLTGAVPSEYYSARKRPDYREYQRTTSRFFPWFPKRS